MSTSEMKWCMFCGGEHLCEGGFMVCPEAPPDKMFLMNTGSEFYKKHAELGPKIDLILKALRTGGIKAGHRVWQNSGLDKNFWECIISEFQEEQAKLYRKKKKIEEVSKMTQEYIQSKWDGMANGEALEFNKLSGRLFDQEYTVKPSYNKMEPTKPKYSYNDNDIDAMRHLFLTGPPSFAHISYLEGEFPDNETDLGFIDGNETGAITSQQAKPSQGPTEAEGKQPTPDVTPKKRRIRLTEED